MRLSRSGLQFALTVMRPVLALAPATYLKDLRQGLRKFELDRAVQERDTAAIFDWIIGLLQLQGISDAVAFGYIRDHGTPTWANLNSAFETGPECRLLASYWHFSDCRYAKTAQSCSMPNLLASCPVPMLPARNGRLSQAAISLFLFMRDVCDGDLVAWLDTRLAQADDGLGAGDRPRRMASAVVEPLSHVHGLSFKVLSMSLADLLLGGDRDRKRWVTAGARMIAIDSLVHNFLHRTGILNRLKAEHPYGDRCYRPGGCADVIEAMSRGIDAQRFNPEFPSFFPRFLQHAVWRFCAQGELNICNGRRIDDRDRCWNRFCPAYAGCARLPLRA